MTHPPAAYESKRASARHLENQHEEGKEQARHTRGTTGYDNDQEQLPVAVLLTLALPVVLISTTRSWLPTLGVARHTTKVGSSGSGAGVTPTPDGWKTRLVTDELIRKPLGAAP